MRNLSSSVLATIGVVAFSGAAVWSAPIPIAHYFNGTNSTVNHANPGTGNLTLTSASVTSQTLPGGLSGFVLDNSSSTMGGAGGTAKTLVSDAQTLIDGKTAITVTGWYKSDSNIAPLARLLDRADNTVGAGQWSLYFDGDTNKLQFNIGGTSFVSNAGFGLNQQWVFYAVTFQGGASVGFYFGDEVNSVSAKGSLATSIAHIGSNSKPLTVANRDSGSRAFDGWLFDVRIYDQALTAAQIESVRGSGIPEPASLLMLVLSGLAMLSRKRPSADQRQ